MRSNRLLGSALIEHSLVKFEDLEAANERLLEIAATGDMRRSSVLSILAYETKVLREEDLLHHVVDDHGVGVIDLRGYEVPDEVKRDLDLGACWATWSVPFDKEEDFHFVATAYYLSPAVRSHWEKSLGGQIIWQATTMDIIADYLDKISSERAEAVKKAGGPARPATRAPFASGPTPILGSKGPFPSGTTAPPMAAANTTRGPFPPADPAKRVSPIPGATRAPMAP
jgi:hypothetical protein